MNEIDVTKFLYIKRFQDEISSIGQFPYSFHSHNSKNLVVVIGDSWSWGADLSDHDDPAIRYNSNFGTIISKELSADFLNLGQCGSCNLHIIERIKELSTVIPTLNYEKIWVICTFTEAARSFDGPYDSTVDYIQWFNSNKFNTIADFNKILEFHNSLFQDAICTLEEQHPHVKVIVGNNFTDPIGMHNKLTMLPKSWLQLITEQILQNKYDVEPCYIMSHWVISKLPPVIKGFKNTIDQQAMTNWLIYLIESAKRRKEFTSNNTYFSVTSHPCQIGHKLWANYILDFIK